MKVVAVLSLLFLAACSTPQTVSGALPEVPADIKVCFRKAVVDIPHRDLTVSDVESLWKKDRIRNVVMRRCGTRFLAWYESLRQNWK
jgi:hypothetical protein